MTAGSPTPEARSPRSRALDLAWRWGPVVAWAALIFSLSAQPGLHISSDASVDGPLRHVAHGFVYTVLVLLVIRGMGRLGEPLTLRTALIAGAATVLYGVSDEVHQAFVPDRSGRAIDVGYDSIGVAIGLTIAWAWGRIRSRGARSVDGAGGARG